MKINIKEKKETVTFNFQVPKENKEELKKKLKAKGLTISSFLNTVIEQYLKKA